MSVAAILAILTGLTELLTIIIKSQPPDVQKTMWERHLQVTQPFFDLLIRMEGQIPKP